MKPRKRKVAVRQGSLERKLAELKKAGCYITGSTTTLSSRRRHGVMKYRVVTVITYIDPRPAPIRCTIFGNRHDFRITPVTASTPRRR